jgi:hypothetical protein
MHGTASVSQTYPTVVVRSGLVHQAPNGWLWQLFADFDSGRVLAVRSLPDGSYLPDWHTNLAGYEDYRQAHPQHGLPPLDQPEDADEGAADDSPEADASGSIESSHAGTGNKRWTVEGIDPDYCVPLNTPVPFDSAAVLGDPLEAGRRVEGSGGVVYREGDRCKAATGNVGPGEQSGAPPEDAIVTFLQGNARVETEGKPTVEHGSLALINSPSIGPGGAIGRVQTELDQRLWEMERYNGPGAAENVKADMHRNAQDVADANRAADEAYRDLMAHQASRRSLPLLSKLFGLGSQAAEFSRRTAELTARLHAADMSVVFLQARASRLSSRLTTLSGGAQPAMSGSVSAQDRVAERIWSQMQASIDRTDMWRNSALAGGTYEAGASREVAEAMGNIATAGRGSPRATSTQRGPQGVHYSSAVDRPRYIYYPKAVGSGWYDRERGRFTSAQSVPIELRRTEAIVNGRTLQETGALRP